MGQILDELLWGADAASEGRGRTLGRVLCLILVWAALLLAAATLHAWIWHADVRWALLRLLCASAAGVTMGALGGMLACRRETCRTLRFYRREAVGRAAWYGLFTALCFVARFSSSRLGLGNCIGAAVIGACVGFFGGLGASFLSPAERAYARAVQLLRQGKTRDAQAAACEYLKHAGKDPLRAARRDVALAFVEGTRASLDVAVELESAPAPGGRGTEPEAGAAPEGRGTEPEAGAALEGCGAGPQGKHPAGRVRQGPRSGGH